jgi:hypothetical protein
MQVQSLWHEHAAQAAALYPASMWRMLNAVKLESKSTQTNVLRACVPLLSRTERSVWPPSRRRIDETLHKQLGSFHSRVIRQVSIDLSHLGVPGLNKIPFRFIDPVFAWAVCAHKLSRAHELHFAYKPLTHPSTGERLFGASVAHGDIMREACLRCGPDSAPALMGISYDSGQASRRRSYTPIIVSVGNTDYCGLNSCICIAYMPVLDIGPAIDPEIAKEAMHQLRQACISVIVDVIESCGKTGFTCMLSEKSPDESWCVPTGYNTAPTSYTPTPPRDIHFPPT